MRVMYLLMYLLVLYPWAYRRRRQARQRAAMQPPRRLHRELAAGVRRAFQHGLSSIKVCLLQDAGQRV